MDIFATNVENINSHLNDCLKEKIKCSKGYGEFVERENLLLHEKECRLIDCPYLSIGCQDKIAEKEKEKRAIQDSSKHLSLAMKAIQNLYEENKELKNYHHNLYKYVDKVKEQLEKYDYSEIK